MNVFWKRKASAVLAIVLCATICAFTLPALADSESETPAPVAATREAVLSDTSATEASAPTPEPPADTTDKSASTEESAPTDTAASEPEAPATDVPATDTPVPVSDTPAPASDTPAPESDTPVAQTDTPAPDGTAATSAAPADTTPAPTETATPDPNAEPTCAIPGCAHVTADADGNPVALCPLGEWMIAHGEASLIAMDAASLKALMDSKAAAAVLPGGTTTLYRSGTYVFTGGNDTTKLVINDNLAVALVLRDATIGEISLGANVTLQFGFTGMSTLDKFHTGSSSGSGTVAFDGTGSLTIAAIDDLPTAQFTMGGGSLLLPSGAVSQNDKVACSFYAPTALSVLVDGVAFPFTTTDSSGTANLWLPTPEAGMKYRYTVVGTVLTITSVAVEPGTAETFDMDGTPDLNAVADKTYDIFSSTGNPLEHTLTVAQTGVILVFDGCDFSTKANVNASQAARIHLRSSSLLKSVAATVPLTLTGAGTLDIATLAADTLYCANTVRLRFGATSGAWTGGWQTIDSPVDLDTITRITYNGRNYAIAYATGDHLKAYSPLPTPAAGMRYDVQLNGTALELTQIDAGTQTLTLGNTDLTLPASGNYAILTSGGVTGSLIVPVGYTVSLILRDTRTTGALRVRAGAAVNVHLAGSNQWNGGIQLDDAATLSVDGSGALLTSRITATGTAGTTVDDGTNITLTADTALGGSSKQPTVINVTDGSGHPVTDTRISMKIGTQKPFSTTTASNGQVTLWRSHTIKNASVVILNKANTFAEILTGNPSNPDALPEITGVTVNEYSFITYTATNAQTSGIQYYINRSGVTMPDTFDASAGQALRVSGECNIPGLKVGDVVSFRVFAARGAGQTLSADTADGFQFSDMVTFTATSVRKDFTLKDQTREYNTYPFKFTAKQVPSDATVTFYDADWQALSSAPKNVGRYYALISIPAGNSEYFPASVTVQVTITKKIVWIYPDYASKIKGEPDPELSYTYSEMFGDDEVTGGLFRVRGENYGNHPYETWSLSAPSYYELKIDPDSPMFFIDWGPGHYIKVDPLSIIDPVHQVLEYTDGTKLNLVLRTVDRLTISKMLYGPIVRDTEDQQTRPFTPELRLKHGYNQAMLILQGEPEINEDGGYATDADGKVQLRGRTLSLTDYHLSRFRNQRITTIGFRLDNAMFMMDLADFSSDTVRQAMADAGMTRGGTRYQITLEPVNSMGDLSDFSQDVQDQKALGAEMMRVRVELKNGGTTLDISKLLPSARMMFDTSAMLAEETDASPDVSEVTIGRKDGQTADEDALSTDVMELVQKLMSDKLKKLGTKFNYYADKIETLDSQLVVPYTASEADALPFTAVMKTSPFLMVRFQRNGLYGLSQTLSE